MTVGKLKDILESVSNDTKIIIPYNIYYTEALYVMSGQCEDEKIIVLDYSDHPKLPVPITIVDPFAQLQQDSL